MSNYKNKEGDIVFFKNEKRATDKHPKLTGNMFFSGETRNGIGIWDYTGDQFTNPNAKFQEKTTHSGHVDISGEAAKIRIHYHGNGQLDKKRPNITGYITIGDRDYKLALWENTANSGLIYWRGSVDLNVNNSLQAVEPNNIKYKNQTVQDDFLSGGNNQQPVGNIHSQPTNDAFGGSNSAPF